MGRNLMDYGFPFLFLFFGHAALPPRPALALVLLSRRPQMKFRPMGSFAHRSPDFPLVPPRMHSRSFGSQVSLRPVRAPREQGRKGERHHASETSHSKSRPLRRS